jgi:Raf kinase inhibitor-like YbhB/YbcL family protein
MSLFARIAATFCALAAVAIAGCGDDDGTVSGELPAAPETMTLKSNFTDGATLPERFTCAGQGVSPPFSWKGQPAKTKQYALLVEDSDAPGGSYVHWSLIDISAALRSIALGTTPVGSEQGANSAGDNDYAPPCPPEGEPPHRYVFAIYALDQSIQLGEGAAPEIVRQGIRERSIARGQITATFGR